MAGAGTETLRVDGLSKRYVLKTRPRRELWALRDVSFATEPGTVLGVVGANGAGKSTLLKVLARVTKPTEGHAAVRGRVVSLLELGGVVQPDLSGVENVYLNGALYGIPRADVTARVDDVFAFAELEEFRDTPVKRYSSGMYLRLAFSVAVNMDPDVLLADEVLAVGDVGFQERCLNRVAEAGEQGLTVLFVSHDMAAIRRLCNRVMWLDRGRVAALGDPDTVVNDYEEHSYRHLAHADGMESGGRRGRITAVRLRSASGAEVAAARTSDELDLVVSFAVDDPRGTARCAIGLDADGVSVFRSVQPEPLALTRAGVHQVAVRIPADLLADRLYSVKAAVILDDGDDRETLVQPNAITFRIYEAREHELTDVFRGPVPGVVRPRLSWQVVSDREAVS